MRYSAKLHNRWAVLVLSCLSLATVMGLWVPSNAHAAPAIPTSVALTCPKIENLHNTSKDDNKNDKNALPCFVQTYVNPFIRFFAGLVGVLVVISIIYGGIQYATSADDPQKVSAAKKRIRDAVIALLCFIFLLAFLDYIVPGGVVNVINQAK